jgi:hypothetical protein
MQIAELLPPLLLLLLLRRRPVHTPRWLCRSAQAADAQAAAGSVRQTEPARVLTSAPMPHPDDKSCR